MTPYKQRLMARRLRKQAVALNAEAERLDPPEPKPKPSRSVTFSSAKPKRSHGYFGELKRHIEEAEKAGARVEASLLRRELKELERKAGGARKTQTRGG